MHNTSYDLFYMIPEHLNFDNRDNFGIILYDPSYSMPESRIPGKPVSYLTLGLVACARDLPYINLCICPILGDMTVKKTLEYK
jgi:hypothetical protein